MPNYRQQSNHGQVTRGIAIFAGLLLERESRLDCRGTSQANGQHGFRKHDLYQTLSYRSRPQATGYTHRYA